LIDGREGRAVARRSGLCVIGTLGVLHQAKLAGLISAVRPHLLRLVDELDFFLNREFADWFLRQIGE
jgi:predicted nucleic acid-binding protein